MEWKNKCLYGRNFWESQLNNIKFQIKENLTTRNIIIGYKIECSKGWEYNQECYSLEEAKEYCEKLIIKS